MEITRKIIEFTKNSTESLSDDKLSRIVKKTPERKLKILNKFIEYVILKLIL